jgi:hypothetical protein
MSKYSIMALMMREENATTEVDDCNFAAEMAELLTAISSKLTADEMEFFIRAGAKIYSSGVEKSGTEISLSDLFPAEEIPDLANEPDGFRKSPYRRRQ